MKGGPRDTQWADASAFSRCARENLCVVFTIVMSSKQNIRQSMALVFNLETNKTIKDLLRMAVNASFISRIIESVTDFQGLIITVYYHLFRFWWYKNNSPLFMEVSSNPKGNPVLILFSIRKQLLSCLTQMHPHLISYF